MRPMRDRRNDMDFQEQQESSRNIINCEQNYQVILFRKKGVIALGIRRKEMFAVDRLVKKYQEYFLS